MGGEEGCIDTERGREGHAVKGGGAEKGGVKEKELRKIQRDE